MQDYFNYTDYFSKMSKKDLEYLFILLKDYKLKSRESLGLNEKISFGVEVEFENVLLYFIRKEFSKYDNLRYWSIIYDKSCSYMVDDFEVGGEVVSPILHDTSIELQSLQMALSILKSLDAQITEHTSLHVHVGSHIFGNDIKNVVNFVKVWSIFEHIIFKFAYGTSKYPRSNIIYFARPIGDALKLKCKYIPLFLENMLVPRELGFDKKWAINFKNYTSLSSEEEVNNTIEIRVANGSLDYAILQNTIYFYLKLMQYVMSDKYDEKLIDRLFKRLRPKSLEQFTDSYIHDAIMLADMIFDHSIDKINFLKQYIKEDEIILVR